MNNTTMNFVNNKIDNLAIALSAIVVATAVGLALSLILSNTMSYVIVAIVVIGYFLVVFKLKKPENKGSADYNEMSSKYPSVVVIGAIGLIILLYGRQFEYSSLWGDIGVYINAASHFRGGGSLPFVLSSLGIELDGYKGLSPPIGMVNPAGDGLWQFHGLPVWPTLMAFSQLPNDGRPVLAVLFGISVILFFTVARDITNNEKGAAWATLLFASLPLAWHQALYATAEMLLVTIFLSGLLLFCKLKIPAIHVGLSLFAYGVVHTGILLLSPVVGICLVLMLFLVPKYDRSQVASIGTASGIAALLAYQFASSFSEKYTGDITHSLFGNHVYLAYVFCLAPLVATFLYIIGYKLASVEQWLKKISHWIYRHFRIIASSLLMLIGIIVAIQAYLLGWSTYFIPETLSKYSSWSARPAYVNHGVESLLHLSLFNIFLASGGIGFLAFILIAKSKDNIAARVKLLWCFVFIFILIFGVYRVDIPNNYYASRYLLPVIVPVLLLLSAEMFGRIRLLKFGAVPVILVSMVFNSATVGSGFFLGSGAAKAFVETNLNTSDTAVIYGSEWLHYEVYPHLIKRSTYKPGETNINKNRSDRQTFGFRLVTDSNLVLGGNRKCFEYQERRIPWQIRYPLEPDLVPRNICLYSATKMVASTLELDGNTWLVGGEFEAIVVAPRQTRSVLVELYSQGWWASKAPFSDNKMHLNPRLTVCGQKFSLVSISPQRIAFQGIMIKPYCKLVFNTETFVPADVGDGNDTRALGADIHTLRISAS